MRNWITGLLLASFVAFTVPANAEDHDGDTPEHRPPHRVAFFTGNTWIPDGLGDGALIVPTYGLDYQFWFSHVFAIGIMSEIELISYTVEKRDGSEEITRETPLVLAVVASYEIVKRLALMLGPGVEFETNESLSLFRMGLEYEFPLPQHWDLSITGIYDYKEHYDTITLGITIGKRFPKAAH